MSADTYRCYLRAAKLKHADPAAILAGAGADLSAKQLAQLVSVLAVQHGYGLPKSMRDPLIDRLLEDGLTKKRIADLLGCNPRTVARRQTEKVGSTNRMDKRPGPDKTGGRNAVDGSSDSDGYGPRILSFCAAGGGDDTRLIQQALSGKQRRW